MEEVQGKFKPGILSGSWIPNFKENVRWCRTENFRVQPRTEILALRKELSYDLRSLDHQMLDIKNTIKVINEMQAEGVIGQYAIGGAVAATFYIEPAATFDIDVFVTLVAPKGKLIVTLDPVYDYLVRERQYQVRDEHIVIFDWQVQFLPAGDPLVEEALTQSVERDIDGIITRIFRAEHLAAIALKLGRPKDKLRLVQFFEAHALDEGQFVSILERHSLLSRWEAFKRQIEG